MDSKRVGVGTGVDVKGAKLGILLPITLKSFFVAYVLLKAGIYPFNFIF